MDYQMDATTLPNLSDYEKIQKFIEQFGIDRVHEILNEKSQKPKELKESPPEPASIAQQKSVKPIFANSPDFDWGGLGHFNKSAFLLEQIELCRKMNDRVKLYELQQQLPGLSARDALLKYSGKCNTFQEVTSPFMQSVSGCKINCNGLLVILTDFRHKSKCQTRCHPAHGVLPLILLTKEKLPTIIL